MILQQEKKSVIFKRKNAYLKAVRDIEMTKMILIDQNDIEMTPELFLTSSVSKN